MKPGLSYSQRLYELLLAMAMTDPYCYSQLGRLEDNSTDWSRDTRPEKLPASKLSPLPRASWGSNSRP